MNNYAQNKITIGDIDLSYYRKGNGKKALILLHGGSQDATIFFNYLDSTNNSHKIYAIDLRAHGNSQCGKSKFSIKDLAIDIMRFINLKPFDKASIIGYADGANIAMYLAKMQPSLIDKLVIISGNLFVNALSPSFSKKLSRKYKTLRPFQNINRKARITLSRLALTLNNIGVYPENLNDFNFPTLIVNAEDDRINKDHAALIAKSIPNALHTTIAGTNHYDIMNSPQLFDTINAFLDGTPLT